MSDFEWNDKNTVLHLQPRTAVYTNIDGDIVIRQMDNYGDDEPYIVIARNNVAKIAAALLAEAGVDLVSQ